MCPSQSPAASPFRSRSTTRTPATMTWICRPPAQLHLPVQRQFEDDDGGVCYIETLDHDTYAGHFRLRLIEFTPTRLAFEIARKDHKYVEVTFDLNANRFGEVKPIVHIIFGVRA